ncbi:MAG TPA: serine/threonine-protein kinase [Steroidobacteraceae bacterium]|nr:serine/threonine-protein kinase [Steroidobacteraceae bacterium]HRX89567.1 serine/threonine-protein kinase [Steroidobacteraceae bacterium]
MRLLLIDDDRDEIERLRAQIVVQWPNAQVDEYSPSLRGPLAAGFLAQGYSAVLLAHSWQGGEGLEWLYDLAARPGFAPIVFVVDRVDGPAGLAARDAGAFAVFGMQRFNEDRLIKALIEAAAHQHNAMQAWHKSLAALDAQNFAGANLRRYRRIEHLAKGSVSDLFLAESEAAGSLVVLKVTRAVRKASGIDQSMQRFLQEFEILRDVDHPNVVQIFDLGITDDHLYIVMEYFARGDLRKRMQQGLTIRECLVYARDLARALQAIHSAGILHRDLKPGNVMLRDDGSVALIDFGLAKARALELEITDSGLIFGTPHYMSPEQGHGRSIDERSDLYSLGVMLYEMVAGQKPYDADNPMAILYCHAKSPIPQLPEAARAVQPVVDALLAKSADDRPASGNAAAELIEVVLEALADAERAA